MEPFSTELFVGMLALVGGWTAWQAARLPVIALPAIETGSNAILDT